MSHEHKYFIFRVQPNFEPLSPDLVLTDADGKLVDPQPDLYQRIEYAISGCPCGDVVKREVRIVQREGGDA